MRELKFRVYDKQCKKFIYLNSCHDTIMFDDREGAHYYNLQFGDGGNELFPLNQYTGIKDINGTEIYEGDIVKVMNMNYEMGDSDTGIGTVEWFDDFGFYNVTNIENSLHELNYQDFQIEIIGNIYEVKE